MEYPLKIQDVSKRLRQFYSIWKTEKINLALKISAHFYFFISIIDDVGFDIMQCFVHIQSWALLFCQSPFYVKIDSFWARDLISCVNGCFWPKWRWVNSFFDFCPFRHTFLTFFENPKKPKMSFFELETWFFGGREVFDQYEHGSTHFFISALLRSKMALYS